MGLKKSAAKRLVNDEFILKARHDRVDFVYHNNIPESDNIIVVDACYIAWLRDHPSALSSFKMITSKAEGKRIVVFLDYDGTLSPIVNDPERAFMSDSMRSAVREVSNRFPTAIISGRSRDKVYNFVKLDGVYYSGSHGMDTMGPPTKFKSDSDKYQSTTLDKQGKELVVYQPALEFLPAIEKLLKEIPEKTSEIEGVLVEDNRFCISVHYRNVKNNEDHHVLEKKIESILVNYPKFHFTRGKMVFEIRPSIEWNKGNALEYLLDTFGFCDSDDDVLPIYIGDDKTDEDAFKVLQKRGNCCPIIVSNTPRETAASYSLHDPSEVLSFLVRLARWGDANFYHK